MKTQVLLLALLLCSVSMNFVLHQRDRRPKHVDPCLHYQSLNGFETWETAEPAVFQHRYGRALEWHLGGVPWDRSKQPPKHHDCKPQTCGITQTLQHYDRCACGSIRYGVWGLWEGRNSRCLSSSALPSE